MKSLRKNSALRIVSGLIFSFALTYGAFAQQYVSSTVAGTPGSSGYTGDGGPATAATMSNPICVAVDPSGNYYFVDSKNYVVREVNAATGVINTVAGNGTAGFSGDGGPATSAQLSNVEGLAIDSLGNLYIADSGNARVRLVDLNGNISTYAGSGTRGYSGDHGPAVNANLFLPAGLALDLNGNLYIADYGSATVREVSSTGIITTAAGVNFIGFAIFPGSFGPAASATLGLPYSVAVDESGNLFIGDLGSSSIRKVDANHKISTFVPQVSTASLAVDPAGNLYYPDYRASTIVKVYPNGTQATIAGNYYSGYMQDGGPGIATEFNRPYSVALDSSSNIYVADYNNEAVRLLTLQAPSGVIVANGASNIAFTAGNNGVSNVPVAIAPGEIVTLFGVGIGPATALQAQPDANGFIETQLGGTTVTFNGIPAPIFSTSYSQVAAIVPYALDGMTQAAVTVSYLGNQIASATVPVAVTAPQIFTPLSTGFTGGAVLNSDGSVNSTTNGAASSSAITIFVTGEGQTFPGGVDGLVAAGPTFPVPIQPVTVTIGGIQATLSSYGGVAGEPAGVLQIIATIPSSVTGTTTASTTATAASGATVLTVVSATGFQVGQLITGSGIPASTTITAVSGTSITISQAVTAALSATNVSVAGSSVSMTVKVGDSTSFPVNITVQ
ncbi:MAG TPA: hypothetical protein VG273_03865 [Bryobacteraceae bacterium]|nr:hypothetical protein [Bryobacteraceae bacterium]